jgi:predicted nucleotidyltransferase component of viral defense system
MVSKTSLTDEQKVHVDVMLSVVESVIDTPMVLKGGTALLLCYHLDRFSEDLDFDSNKKINLKKRIHDSIAGPVEVKSIDVLKDTDTVSRYRVVYETTYGVGRLKIETSLREAPKESHIINGIKVYPIQTLIQQKLVALENRTRARDLYDVNFLAKNYPNAFSESSLSLLINSVKNLDSLEKRFAMSFEEDSILYKENVTKLVLTLQESANLIKSNFLSNSEKHKKLDKGASSTFNQNLNSSHRSKPRRR